MVGGAVVNALAFSGSNYLFSMFNAKAADEERVRHDKALEEFQNAQAEYSRRRQLRLDYLNEQLRKEHDAAQALEDVDDAMRAYWEVTGGDLKKMKDVPEDGLEPALSDYYEPSAHQQSCEIAFIIGGIGLVGFAASRLL